MYKLANILDDANPRMTLDRYVRVSQEFISD